MTDSPATEYARIKLAATAFADIAKEATAAVGDNVYAARDLTGARAFDTPFGPVSITRPKPAIVMTDAALLRWAEDNMPGAIVPMLPDMAKRQILARFVIDGDTVVDKETGEVVEEAGIRPASKGTITFRPTPEAKADARRTVEAWITAADLSTIAPKEVEA